MTSAQRPIGVFDSGIGGLSVLQALQKELPHERFVYIADNAHAPYGEKTEEFVVERALAVTAFLLDHGAKALVEEFPFAAPAAPVDVPPPVRLSYGYGEVPLSGPRAEALRAFASDLERDGRRGRPAPGRWEGWSRTPRGTRSA